MNLCPFAQENFILTWLLRLLNRFFRWEQRNEMGRIFLRNPNWVKISKFRLLTCQNRGVVLMYWDILIPIGLSNIYLCNCVLYEGPRFTYVYVNKLMLTSSCICSFPTITLSPIYGIYMVALLRWRIDRRSIGPKGWKNQEF